MVKSKASDLKLFPQLIFHIGSQKIEITWNSVQFAIKLKVNFVQWHLE